MEREKLTPVEDRVFCDGENHSCANGNGNSSLFSSVAGKKGCYSVAAEHVQKFMVCVNEKSQSFSSCSPAVLIELEDKWYLATAAHVFYNDVVAEDAGPDVEYLFGFPERPMRLKSSLVLSGGPKGRIQVGKSKKEMIDINHDFALVELFKSVVYAGPFTTGVRVELKEENWKSFLGRPVYFHGHHSNLKGEVILVTKGRILVRWCEELPSENAVQSENVKPESVQGKETYILGCTKRGDSGGLLYCFGDDVEKESVGGEKIFVRGEKVLLGLLNGAASIKYVSRFAPFWAIKSSKLAGIGDWNNAKFFPFRNCSCELS